MQEMQLKLDESKRKLLDFAEHEQIIAIGDRVSLTETNLQTSNASLSAITGQRIQAEQARTGLAEAAVVGQGFIKGIRIVIGITDSSFIMGSMGSVVGEKLTRAIEEATRQKLPLVIVSGSGGGARMHEGIFSLMQMAKVSTALGRYHSAGGIYLSILTHPTMGGVAASFASLGDFILAEPKALIGFAGPRVIEQTVRVQLPAGFQTSEFLCEHGFIDRIVNRRDLRSTIAQLIDYTMP